MVALVARDISIFQRRKMNAGAGSLVLAPPLS
jgi:hypothetical protein